MACPEHNGDHSKHLRPSLHFSYPKGAAAHPPNAFVRPDFLTDIIPRERLFFEEPMSRHTTFKIGGPAEILLVIETEDEIIGVVEALRHRHIPFTVIGKGSNLLAADAGCPGVIIKLAMQKVYEHGGLLRAEAGVSLRKLYEQAVSLGFTGLEFAAGIPGTLGGGITMNAGAYGGELKDVIRSVRLLDKLGNITVVPGHWMQFGYRTSVVARRGLIVLSADLQLPHGDIAKSRSRVNELQDQRQEKQPLSIPSAGSTFKRPQGQFAGALIEQCGLKGASAGGAQVSKKHAGFIVNADNASASDIYRLIMEVRRIVYDFSGVVLEPEVKFLGDFNA